MSRAFFAPVAWTREVGRFPGTGQDTCPVACFCSSPCSPNEPASYNGEIGTGVRVRSRFSLAARPPSTDRPLPLWGATKSEPYQVALTTHHEGRTGLPLKAEG